MHLIMSRMFVLARDHLEINSLCISVRLMSNRWEKIIHNESLGKILGARHMMVKNHSELMWLGIVEINFIVVKHKYRKKIFQKILK